MLEFIKRQKAAFIAIIIIFLGWFGFTVTQEQVTPYVDQAIETTEQISNVATDAKDTFFEKDLKEAPEQTSEDSETQTSLTEDFNQAGLISDERRTHILFGDATGGGHLHGVGKPCKSEFPKHWSEDTIIKEIELIAANDNLSWRQEDNGYYVTEENVGNVRVRVVKNRDNTGVITAYPVNIERNPCPANDN
ncbi:MAG: EndoU domain-containing protein [Pseudomonadota bacterium]